MKILQFISILSIVATSEVLAQFGHRTVHGRNCNTEEYPYLAAIALGGNVFCGGSFITTGWMLTAAHCCMVMKQRKKFTVVAGKNHWYEDFGQTSTVDATFPYKHYKNLPVSGDICLIKLKQSITLSANVMLTKLATTSDYEGFIKEGKCNKTLSMRGSPLYRLLLERKTHLLSRRNQEYLLHIRCANLPILEQAQCNDNQNFSQSIFKHVVCMMNEQKKNVDTCQGDPGGPVFCGNLQIGVVSTGFGCRDRSYPGFYTRVDKFKDYIERAIKRQVRTLTDDSHVTVSQSPSAYPIPRVGHTTLQNETKSTNVPRVRIVVTKKYISASVEPNGSCQMLMFFVPVLKIIALFLRK